jgi:hypothetical protein
MEVKDLSEFDSASEHPSSLSMKSIRDDGLVADYFHGVSDKPREALIAYSGSTTRNQRNFPEMCDNSEGVLPVLPMPLS